MTHFADTWSVDSLSNVVESQPSVVRRHLGFWVSQGILKEQSSDVFAVVERLQEGIRSLPQGKCTVVVSIPDLPAHLQILLTNLKCGKVWSIL